MQPLSGLRQFLNQNNLKILRAVSDIRDDLRSLDFDVNQLKYTVVDTLSYRTKSTKKEDVDRTWFVVDAEGETVGRICSKIAHVLKGKHKPSYTPHIDCGDNVIVVNAEKIRFTGKKWDQKEYISYSGYPGGQKKKTAGDIRATRPYQIVEKAVRGMLPKNRLGRQMIKKLFVYAGPEHPHQAQKPEPFKI